MADDDGIGPIERRAREFLGQRPDRLPETTYLYAVRELVDMWTQRHADFDEVIGAQTQREGHR